MRLFLTATSERGKPVTKSGNEFITVNTYHEKREVNGSIDFIPRGLRIRYDGHYIELLNGEEQKLKRFAL